ncbi:carboxymuconolactone decarboxylase family protein [Pseudonocardia alni]|uniref:carboxymuconolactone decarboxylase family protein n=1 Tax=Pseudonocardia alni TaxID=33907 RepID=UPI00280B40F3|nr:hypothetical protein [Pseudonocardia alni]
MARIPLPEPADMGPRHRAQYERFPSHLTRTLTVMDPRLSEALPETANALRASALAPAWREGAILRVAALTGSAYERLQHLDQARRHWSDEQVAAIETTAGGDRSALPIGFARLLDLVDLLVPGLPVPDDVLAAVRRTLDDRELVTLIVLVGHYLTVARLTTVLDVDLDPVPDPWTREH